jgi:hypothetical protein
MNIGGTDVAFHTQDPPVDLIVVADLTATQPAEHAWIVAGTGGIADKSYIGLSKAHA